MSAENERIKLRATFYNNLAVGAAITGLLVPYIAIWPKLWNPDVQLGRVSLASVVSLESIAGMIVAAVICLFCRSRADTWIKTLDDED